jgi:hypothetical protein
MIKMTHTFDVSDEQYEELKLLQKAMQNYAVQNGDSREQAEEYYTIEETFEFVMQLGQNQLISNRIENAAWHYDENYDKGTYKYKYGRSRFLKESEDEI